MQVFSDLKKGTKTFDNKLLRHYLYVYFSEPSWTQFPKLIKNILTTFPTHRCWLLRHYL